VGAVRTEGEFELEEDGIHIPPVEEVVGFEEVVIVLQAQLGEFGRKPREVRREPPPALPLRIVGKLGIAHVQEIAARLRALIRRSAGKGSPVLVHNDIELSPVSGSVTVAGKPVDLTAQEFRILNYFMHRRGRVISQNELIEHLYPIAEERDPNTIEVYIGRLRRKLGRDIIKTLRGLGYRFG